MFQVWLTLSLHVLYDGKRLTNERMSNIIFFFIPYVSDNIDGEMTSTQADICSSNPCKNNGDCIIIEQRYFCECDPTYTGRHCDMKTVKDDETNSQSMQPENK